MSRLAALPPLLLGLVILVLAQLAGLGLAALLHLPVPGVVIGLVLLVIVGAQRPAALLARLAEPAGTPLLKHLQLLFIPPGVGIVIELEALAQNALPIALAVGGSSPSRWYWPGSCSRHCCAGRIAAGALRARPTGSLEAIA